MISALFIRRPRFATVIAIVMSIAGLLALFGLPISQYPNIAPPTVTVSAVYPGASAQVIADVVGDPLESAINGVDDMIYMSSSSSDSGAYSLTVTFAVGTDPNLAQINVQNRAQTAMSLLPAAVSQQGITVRASAPDFLVAFGFYSPDSSLSDLEVANFLSMNVSDALSRVSGVGETMLMGASEYSMRVWMDPVRMAALGITADDLAAAIQSQNIQASLGQVGAPPTTGQTQLQYTLVAEGRLRSAEEFGDIVVRAGQNGALVRVRDIARVELGAQSYSTTVAINGRPGTMLVVNQEPGANALATAAAVKAELERLRPNFPPGLAFEPVYDATLFVQASISEIITTLAVTFLIVVVTTFLFLGDWRATLIPSIAIPVSLIATFAVLLVMGFSLNLISLLALILATGLVVDDAILVVENVQRLMAEEGLGAADAARKAMEQVTGPIIATTLVLLGVFVPTAFLPGINGQLYQQFAVTISAALVFSSLTALTLSPALCAAFLRAPTAPRGISALFSRGMDRLSAGYLGLVRAVTRRLWLVVGGLVAAGGVAAILLGSVPGSFLPDEDQGFLFLDVQLPDAAALSRTQATLREVESILLQTPGVAKVVSVAGFSLMQGNAPSGGFAIVTLADWSERTGPGLSTTELLGTLNRRFAAIPNATVAVFAPPPISGVGQVGGLDFRLQAQAGQSPEELAQVVRSFLARANARPEMAMAMSSFSADVPRVAVTLDRARAEGMGVSTSSVFAALGASFGGRYVNDFTLDGRAFQVNLQADEPFRAVPDDVLEAHVRSASGAMVPLRSLVTIEPDLGPFTINRYNLFPSAQINGVSMPGVSSGVSMQAFEEVAADSLPQGYGYEWSGLSLQERQSAAQAPIIFGLALLFAFLFLVAQYESWTLPISIILSLAFAAFGAMAALALTRTDNSLYAQIGIVLLIGLASKNAILIVEFARVQHEELGKPLVEAAVTAAGQRFRAVMMTAISFIFGIVPLAVATGAGAGARQALGVTILGGMLAATTIGILLIPGLYVLVQGSSARMAGLFRRRTA